MIEKNGSFQNRLKSALDNKGISQAELARRTGINKQIISDYLNGKYEAKQNNIYKLAKELNVNEAWLMGFKTYRKDRQHAPKSIEDEAEEYVKSFRSYGDKEITDQQREAIKAITLSYLKSQFPKTDPNKK